MPVAWGNITVKEIIDPISGSLISGRSESILAGINTDSRTTQEGDLFWALKGDRYDGHEFALQAMEKGASGIVVQSNWMESKRPDRLRDVHGGLFKDRVVISVDDTLRALGDLAAWWRSQHHVKVIGITGSSGKTTTKEMTATILELGKKTLKNHGNFNNLIGLPLTLLRLDSSYECAVMEMGMNHPGEISRLTEIADPDVGVILNIGMAHLEGLSDLDGVARAKTELIEGMSSEGLVILNGDDVPLMQRASLYSKRKMTFGLGKENDVRATGIHDEGPKGTRFTLEYGGSRWPVYITIPGLHHMKNALAAAAISLSLGETPHQIIQGLGMFRAIKGRFQVIPLEGEITLVDDTYNANPSSVGAAIDAVATMVPQGGRLIIALGEMLELGDVAIEAHREVGQKVAAKGASHLFAIGNHAPEMIESARLAGMPDSHLKIMATLNDMVAGISEILSRGDLILVKGSRRMELEKVVEGLRTRSRKQ